MIPDVIDHNTTLTSLEHVLYVHFIKPCYACPISDDFAQIPASSNNARAVGFLVDAAVKRTFAGYGAVIPADRYAPYDFEMNGTFFEIKSSAKFLGANAQVFVSGNEVGHANTALQNGTDTCYLFFDAREGVDSVKDIKKFKFVGLAYYSEIAEHMWLNEYGGYSFKQEMLRAP